MARQRHRRRDHARRDGRCAPDPNDPATTQVSAARRARLYKISQSDGAQRRAHRHSARVLLRANVGRRITSPRGGLTDEQRAIMNEVMPCSKRRARHRRSGGHPKHRRPRIPTNNFLNWSPCSGLDNGKGTRRRVLHRVQVRNEARLQHVARSRSAPSAPVKTLTELRAMEHRTPAAGAIKYGQQNLDISDEMDVHADKAATRPTGQRTCGCRRPRARRGDEGRPSRRAALPRRDQRGHRGAPGYPTVTVPYVLCRFQGTGANAFPAGFNPEPAPFNVSFTGAACSEPKLIEFAYAFEQATKKRHAPPQFP